MKNSSRASTIPRQPGPCSRPRSAHRTAARHVSRSGARRRRTATGPCAPPPMLRAYRSPSTVIRSKSCSRRGRPTTSSPSRSATRPSERSPSRGPPCPAAGEPVATPVLVVPPTAQPPDEIRRADRDGGHGREHAVAQAHGRARVGCQSRTRSDSCRRPMLDPGFSDQVQHETERTSTGFSLDCSRRTRAQLELRIGVPVEEILNAAAAIEPDLLAMGWPQTDDPARGTVAANCSSGARFRCSSSPSSAEV